MVARSLPWCLALAASLVAAPSEAQTLTTVDVAMRDGVTLKTDVWTPAGATTPRPVLLRRTPYGRALDMGVATGLTNLGYVVVSQDVRGRGGSAGAFLPFFDDRVDGPDTMTWVAAQPWSNGRIGSWGGSAEGIVQLMALPEAPDALDCAFVVVATDDVYEGIYPGGAWRTELTTAWLQGLMAPDALAAWRAHEPMDAWWDPARLDAAERAMTDAKVILVGGFFDIFAVGTPRTHRALQAQVAPAARGDQFLLMGPWTHGGLGETQQGGVAFAAASRYDAYVTELVGFFDWCLKDGPRPAWEPVRYWMTRLADDGLSAGGEWRTAALWPPASTPATLHLHDDGFLRAGGPAAAGAAAALPVDPLAPVPSIGGGNLTTAAGPFDQAALDARADALAATTAPATADVELLGDVEATIWAASATTDVDVVVRLTQVTPDGKSILLADGIRRGRFVGGDDAIRPLTPNAAAEFRVTLGPVAFVLPAGHALRVAISGTSSPRYEPNPGTAAPLSSSPPSVATTLTVLRDAAHPSAVVLPVASGVLPEAPGGPPDAGPLAADAAPGAPDASGAGADGGGGCGCRVAATPTGAPPAALILLLASAVLRRGKRSQ